MLVTPFFKCHSICLGYTDTRYIKHLIEMVLGLVLILQDWVLYVPSCSSHGQEAIWIPIKKSFKSKYVAPNRQV